MRGAPRGGAADAGSDRESRRRRRRGGRRGGRVGRRLRGGRVGRRRRRRRAALRGLRVLRERLKGRDARRSGGVPRRGPREPARRRRKRPRRVAAQADAPPRARPQRAAAARGAPGLARRPPRDRGRHGRRESRRTNAGRAAAAARDDASPHRTWIAPPPRLATRDAGESRGGPGRRARGRDARRAGRRRRRDGESALALLRFVGPAHAGGALPARGFSRPLRVPQRGADATCAPTQAPSNSWSIGARYDRRNMERGLAYFFPDLARSEERLAASGPPRPVLSVRPARTR